MRPGVKRVWLILSGLSLLDPAETQTIKLMLSTNFRLVHERSFEGAFGPVSDILYERVSGRG